MRVDKAHSPDDNNPIERKGSGDSQPSNEPKKINSFDIDESLRKVLGVEEKDVKDFNRLMQVNSEMTIKELVSAYKEMIAEFKNEDEGFLDLETASPILNEYNDNNDLNLQSITLLNYQAILNEANFSEEDFEIFELFANSDEAPYGSEEKHQYIFLANALKLAAKANKDENSRLESLYNSVVDNTVANIIDIGKLDSKSNLTNVLISLAILDPELRDSVTRITKTFEGKNYQAGLAYDVQVLAGDLQAVDADGILYSSPDLGLSKANDFSPDAQRLAKMDKHAAWIKTKIKDIADFVSPELAINKYGWQKSIDHIVSESAKQSNIAIQIYKEDKSPSPMEMSNDRLYQLELLEALVENNNFDALFIDSDLIETILEPSYGLYLDKSKAMQTVKDFFESESNSFADYLVLDPADIEANSFRVFKYLNQIKKLCSGLKISFGNSYEMHDLKKTIVWGNAYRATGSSQEALDVYRCNIFPDKRYTINYVAGDPRRFARIAVREHAKANASRAAAYSLKENPDLLKYLTTNVSDEDKENQMAAISTRLLYGHPKTKAMGFNAAKDYVPQDMEVIVLNDFKKGDDDDNDFKGFFNSPTVPGGSKKLVPSR